MRCLTKGKLLNIVQFGIEQFFSSDITSGNICLRRFVKTFVRTLQWYTVVSSPRPTGHYSL